MNLPSLFNKICWFLQLKDWYRYIFFLLITSVVDPDPFWICIKGASWIRIYIPNKDLDPHMQI